jgi:O-antigen/teichoic acid export membrane protein
MNWLMRRFDMPKPESIAASLKRRVIGAGFWSLSGFALSYPLRLASSLVMTRLLVPEMFGVMAIAMMVMMGLAMFSDVGLRPSIIRSSRGNDLAFLNTAWVIQIIRGLLLWLLAICISLLILTADRLGLVPKASAYADPHLPHVIAIVSISAAISGFQSTKFIQASRHLLLGRVTMIQMVAQVIGLICMIGWALLDRSIWALIAGTICSSAVSTLLSHIWLPGVANRWQWDRSAVHEIIHFGKWMFLATILGFFAANADRALLGGFVDSTTLGIYSIAFTVFTSVKDILTKIISDVSFPALAELAREQSQEIKRSFYRLHIVTAPFAYFCAGGLIVSGDTLIGLLYDRRYEQAGWMLEVLAIGLMVVPFNLSQLCLLTLGMPKIFAYIIALRAGCMVILVPLGFHFFAIQGAVWAIVLSQLSNLPATLYYQFKCDLLDPSKELLLLPTLFAGMLVGKGFNLAIGH